MTIPDGSWAGGPSGNAGYDPANTGTVGNWPPDTTNFPVDWRTDPGFASNPIPPPIEWKGAPKWWNNVDQQFLPQSGPILPGTITPVQDSIWTVYSAARGRSVIPDIPMAPVNSRKRKIKLVD